MHPGPLMTTLEQIQQIFAKRFALPVERVRPESSLESLQVDSLDALEVLFEIEDVFHIRIPDDAAKKKPLNTVQDIVNLVDSLTAQSKADSA